MANRFYINRPLGPGLVGVEGPEARHLAVVCRLRPGDPVCLFNGDGWEYHGRVADVAKARVEVDVAEVRSPAREVGYHIEVAAPLPKGDRGQFLLEKLTELGATRYVPLRTRRSVLHPGEGRQEKLQRYVIEASKQCGRNVLLQVEPVAEWASYCRESDLPARRLLAHVPESGENFGRGSLSPNAGDVVLAVGPEGGFTDEEIDEGLAHGWKVVGLGARTLRIETAALVLAAWAARAVS